MRLERNSKCRIIFHFLLYFSSQPDNFTASTSESGYSNTTTTTNQELTKISVISPQRHQMETVVVHHQPDCHVLAKHKLAGAEVELFSAR